MDQRLKKFLSSNSDYSFITCLGVADRVGSASRNIRLAERRAKAACSSAMTHNPDLVLVSATGRWDQSRGGSSIRKVRIVLSHSSTSEITTKFDYQGGIGGPAQLTTTQGKAIALPSPEKPGLRLLGWYTKLFDKKIGDAKELYTAKVNATLYALWGPPAPSYSGVSADAGGGSGGGGGQTCVSSQLNPVNTAAPVVTFDSSVSTDLVLRVSTGTWTNLSNCTNSYSYEWQYATPTNGNVLVPLWQGTMPWLPDSFMSMDTFAAVGGGNGNNEARWFRSLVTATNGNTPVTITSNVLKCTRATSQSAISCVPFP